MKTNYFKIGLYAIGTIIVFVAIYMVYRAILRAKQGVDTVGDVIQDNKVDKEIAAQTGLMVSEVNAARKIAKHFAEELELLRGMSWWDRQRAMITDKELMDIASQVKSAQQMKTISHIFQNELTYNKSLYAELKKELPSAKLRAVPFIETIIN
jgi:hypothetical protein